MCIKIKNQLVKNVGNAMKRTSILPVVLAASLCFFTCSVENVADGVGSENIATEQIGGEVSAEQLMADSIAAVERFVSLGGFYFTDDRDGILYKAINIGNQTWMAENLNYDVAGYSWCYGNNAENCKKYGHLYTRDVAMFACPVGWHLPSEEEWRTLSAFVGGEEKSLKSTLWGGFDSFGFSVLPGGALMHDGNFVGDLAVFWSSTMYMGGNDNICAFFFGGLGSSSRLSIGIGTFSYKIGGNSVRCILGPSESVPASSSSSQSRPKSSSSVFVRSSSSKTANNLAGTFTDARDGKVYKTVTIGSQTWMAENLKYKLKYYEEGNSFCYEGKSSNCSKYGYLYDGTAATTSACPSGWHLPCYAEWSALITAAGGNGAALKLKSKTGWNGGANGIDSFGFSVLPAGYRDIEGLDVIFDKEGEEAYFWSAEYYSEFSGRVWNFSMYSADVDTYYNFMGPYVTYSIRCVKD